MTRDINIYGKVLAEYLCERKTEIIDIRAEFGDIWSDILEATYAKM